MKKNLLLILFVGALGFVSTAQEKAEPVKHNHHNHKHETTKQIDTKVNSGAIMTFESTVVDYGTIDQHSEPLRSLKFTNTGTEPLIIKNARGSCGCTVPVWPKEPIMPGEESKIDVRYATNRLGNINKKITITTNEGGNPHILKVIGKVVKPEEDAGVPKGEPSILNGGN